MSLVRSTTKPTASFEPYDPRFTTIATLVIKAIQEVSTSLLAEHIGSTAVPGCAGKGIVDIMVVYAPDSQQLAHSVLEDLGFHPQGPEFKHRDSFPDDHLVRIGELDHDGDTFRCYVHAIPENSHEVARFRTFRERLREDSALLEQYVAVKRAAIDAGVSDTDDYVVRKIAVIKEILGDERRD